MQIGYSAENLKAAIDDIKHESKSFRGASQFYNIPKTTLMHHVKGTRGVEGRIVDDSRGGGSVKAYLPFEVEQEIANCLKILDKKGTDQTNPWVFYNYFEKLTKIVNDLQLNGKPQQIYNCDEPSFCHDPSKTKTIGAINTRNFRKASSAARENTTALLCCSASGEMLPLLCVFKRKSVMQNWLETGLITKTAVSVTERGWMKTTLFHNWFRDVFLKNIGFQRPVLLIYDGHVTHISFELIKLAQENQVTIIKLPPHTTHVLQPLDVAVFKGLKTKGDREVCKCQ
ncbi:hypothetical protein ILUMI_16251 [Ignelater luminosus]|uniref:HTH psq-type domain-containing protein n=1 Tax=Ignelater luminosus TaxID=2038154 RepID=A0A8K0CRE4_IGNLU|nr:hypothetical protein ILUMI_16251 [Ignelater luminosus]